LDFAKQKRSNKILIDYKRHHRGAVAVAAYSTRALPNGPICIPVSWRLAFAGAMDRERRPVEGFLGVPSATRTLINRLFYERTQAERRQRQRTTTR
jgi:hypothetical protein